MDQQIEVGDYIDSHFVLELSIPDSEETEGISKDAQPLPYHLASQEAASSRLQHSALASTQSSLQHKFQTRGTSIRLLRRCALRHPSSACFATNLGPP
jgi:hypothetical protein